jgi:hypothetical protein
MGKLWETGGKLLENYVYEKIIGNMGNHHGETMGIHGETMGIHGETMGIHGETIRIHGGKMWTQVFFFSMENGKCQNQLKCIFNYETFVHNGI